MNGKHYFITAAEFVALVAVFFYFLNLREIVTIL